MTTNIQINCSGALFSSLQYELINNKKLQEGFLLGHIEKYTSHSISDSEMNNENTNIVINVSGYIPCSTMGSFYSGSGRVNFEHMKQHVDLNMKKVVGWYRSRRFSDIMYLKEMRIHEQLREEMSHTDGHFLFALFSRIQPAESGTMDVNYKFQIMLNNNEFEGVPLRIVNMTDTSSQYIRTAPSAALYSSKSLDAILQTLHNMEPGVKEVEQLHNGLLNQLRNLLPKYASIQEQHHKALKLVNEMQECCYSSEIRPEFKPNDIKDCDFDLMDLELSPKSKAKHINGSTSKISDHQDSESTAVVKKSDPFGFVKKEMEKQQENGLSKKKSFKTKKERSDSDSETNTLKGKTKPKVVKKLSTDNEPSRVRNASGKARASHSSSSSPCRKKENVLLKTPSSSTAASKARSVRGLKLNSLEEKSPPAKARHRSPSLGAKVSPKRKDKEVWTGNKLCSDSPEF